jgi:putative transposase
MLRVKVLWVINPSANSTHETRNMFRVSRFAELLKHLPRSAFDQAVRAHQADKHRKGFSCWQQLIAMLYAQLSGASSLRVLASGFNAHSAHHYHLRCAKVHRSTLAEANARARSEVFSALTHALMQRVHRRVRSEGEQVLRLIDSSSLTLKGHGFDAWTRAQRTRNTQGVKLHVVLGLPEQAPLDQAISAANLNDVHYARGVRLERGAVYVFDKAYCDYHWWWQITQSGAQFVSRFKRNARLQVLSERRIARCARGVILKDQRVLLSNRNPGAGRSNPYTAALRRIEVARAKQPPLVLVTNDLSSSALRIAEHYRARWQIELFFKWIKQHLRIKQFLGRSENAVRIQILTALIAYLLAALDAQTRAIRTSLWLHLSELRATLFQRPLIELHRHRRWRQQRAFFQAHQQVLFV